MAPMTLRTRKITPPAGVCAIDPRHISTLTRAIGEKVLLPGGEDEDTIDEDAIGEMPPNADQDPGDEDPESAEARLTVRGLITPQAELYRYFGVDATSPDEISAGIDAALELGAKSIDFVFDTPGGDVTGVPSAADKIFSLRSEGIKTRSIVAYAASAGYWLASQAEEVVMLESVASAGSIGAYTVVEDTSGLFSAAGIKVHLIASGEHKGVGTPGVEVTEAQLAPYQRGIDQVRDLFVAAVARGRGLEQSQVANLATGETWMAEEAVQLKIADRLAPSASERSMQKEIAALAAVVADLSAKVEKVLEAKQAPASEPVKPEPKPEPADLARQAAKSVVAMKVAAGQLAPIDAELAESLVAKAEPDQVGKILAMFKAPDVSGSKQTTDGEQKPTVLSPIEAKMCKLFGLTEAELNEYAPEVK